MKLPEYVIKSAFISIVTKPAKVSSSGRFIYRGDCPLCTDARQRMYIKDYGDDYMVYCHNCGYSNSFRMMIRDWFPSQEYMLREYYINSIADGSFREADKKEKEQKKLKFFNENKVDSLDVKLRFYANKHGFSIGKKQTDPELEKFRELCYLTFKNRKLPMEFIKSLWCFTSGPLKDYCGIPFFDRTGNNIIHWQGRRMWEPIKGSDDEKYNPKYKFLKDVKEGIEIENKPIWGMHRVNTKRRVLLFEGVLDAAIVENAVALSGASISDMFISKVKTIFPYRVWAPDNFWKDEAGQRLTIKLLEMQERCFVFPPEVKQKDANQYIIENGLTVLPEEYVEKNTYIGKQGLLQLRYLAMKEGIVWTEKPNGKYQRS